MSNMFRWATSFNCDISKWDVSSVAYMDDMFWHATSFKQTLCGAAWVHSKASKNLMFTNSPGSISRTACITPVTSQYVSRRPITKRERELIARTPIRTPVSTSAITSMIASTKACLKCGVFKKSGRASCCAPGGAWYKNCGGYGNKHVDHSWPEGMKACKCKFKANDMYVDTPSSV